MGPYPWLVRLLSRSMLSSELASDVLGSCHIHNARLDRKVAEPTSTAMLRCGCRLTEGDQMLRRRRFVILTAALPVAATISAVVLISGTGAGASTSTGAGSYVKVPPMRILDTRSGVGAPKAAVGGLR